MLKIQEIREIIQLIDESSIDEFTYKTGDAEVCLKKSGEAIQVNPVNQPVHSLQQTKEPVQAVQAAPVKQAAEQNQAVNVQANETAAYDYEIVSPMVGTFYASSSPEADAFVKSGSKVNNDTVVCIVEAMKLFNEIEAETNGEIVEVLVRDGELVEYGQPLFRVKSK